MTWSIVWLICFLFQSAGSTLKPRTKAAPIISSYPRKNGKLLVSGSNTKDLTKKYFFAAIKLFHDKSIEVSDLSLPAKIEVSPWNKNIVDVTQRLLYKTLCFGENWARIGKELKVDPKLTSRLYKAVRSSMKSHSQPWSTDEDDALLRTYAENSFLLGVASIELYRCSENAANFSYFAVWRNISHTIGRSSSDCRLRVRALERLHGSGGDVSSSQVESTIDSWASWEVAQLAALIGSPGQADVHFAQVGRHLGRSSRQCYLCYHSTQYSTLFTNNLHTNKDFNFSEVSPPVSVTDLTQRSASIDNARSWSSRRWTAEADSTLMRLVKEHGASWTLISKQMVPRTPASCFARHHLLALKAEYIDGTSVVLNRSDNVIGHKTTQNGTIGRSVNSAATSSTLWTDEKKSELARLVQIHGGHWTRICQLLGPGYSPYSARSVYMRMALNRPDQLLIPVKSGRVSSSYEVLNDHNSVPQFSFLNATIVLETQRAAAVRRSSQGIGLYGRRWTRQDDRVLAQLAQRHDRQWTLVAEQMNRSPEDVMIRFDFKLSSHRHGAWKREEDARLIEFVEQHGDAASGWSKIGDEINRSAAQCALRWRVTLDPRLKWRPWSSDEDDRLCFLREERGYNWVMISASLNRASASCRYRYVKLNSSNKNVTSPS